MIFTWDISISARADCSASITTEGLHQKIEPKIGKAPPNYGAEKLAALSRR